MAAVRDAVQSPDAERRFLLTDVPWAAYVSLREALDSSRVQMTYLAGSLELMSPSKRHEEESKLIARLLEAWAEEHDLDLRGFKSTTFRNEARARGAEPDECYSIGPLAPDAPPPLAIEVVVSSPLLDKLDVYAGLGGPRSGSGTARPATSPCIASPRAGTSPSRRASCCPRSTSACSRRSCALVRTRPRS